jgi:hypothetical protein
MSRFYIDSPTTFYVNNIAGNDANDGFSAATAYQTIQRAVDELQEDFDFAAQPTIQIATTGVDYNETVVLGRYVGTLGYTQNGYTYPKIQGDPTNNAAVRIHNASGAPFTSVHGFPWIIGSLMVATDNSYGIISDAHAHLLLSNLNFGNCLLGHMCSEYGGWIETLAGPYTISGGSTYHICVVQRGEFVAQGNGIAFVQTAGVWPSFTYFAQGSSWGFAACGQMSIASGICSSSHPNQVNNDGTAMMHPMGNGLWP